MGGYDSEQQRRDSERGFHRRRGSAVSHDRGEREVGYGNVCEVGWLWEGGEDGCDIRDSVPCLQRRGSGRLDLGCALLFDLIRA